MSFDDWSKNKIIFIKSESKESYEAGQQSRQAEIDELQKCINEALKHVVDHGGYDDLTHVINILKGNKND